MTAIDPDSIRSVIATTYLGIPALSPSLVWRRRLDPRPVGAAEAEHRCRRSALCALRTVVAQADTSSSSSPTASATWSGLHRRWRVSRKLCWRKWPLVSRQPCRLS